MISVSDRSGIHHFENFDDYLEYAEGACEFCDAYRGKHACHGNIMCKELAGYEECKIKGRTSSVCRDMMRPLATPLQERIVALIKVAGF